MNPVNWAEARHWEHFYSSDGIGVRGFGDSLDQAFEEVGRALTAVVTEPEQVQPSEALDVGCEGADNKELLEKWLQLLIHCMNSRHTLYSHFEVEIREGHLKAKIWGQAIHASRHAPRPIPNGVLTDRLWVGMRRDGEWCVQCGVKA